MPIVRIDIQSGKSTLYKRALLNGVREAITTALSVPDERVMVRVVETPAEDIDATEIRTDRLTIVEVSMMSGRDAVLKNSLYQAIAKRLALAPGVAASDLVVVIADAPGECFYLNGSIQCDLAQSPSQQAHPEELPHA